MSASTHFPRLVDPEAIDRRDRPVGDAPHVDDAIESTGHRDTDPVEGRVDLTFDDVYREFFSFVWRSVKRLGVRDASLDDVVQEVFVIVHRRLSGFEGRSSLRTWLFGIALRVARDHRRSVARKNPAGERIDPDTLRSTMTGPSETTERAEAVRLLYAILDELDDERREVFVMAELEQITMPEIAQTLGLNINTTYARLRAARISFEQALARHRARDEWRLK